MASASSTPQLAGAPQDGTSTFSLHPAFPPPSPPTPSCPCNPSFLPPFRLAPNESYHDSLPSFSDKRHPLFRSASPGRERTARLNAPEDPPHPAPCKAIV